MTEIIEEIKQGDHETGIRGQGGRLFDYWRFDAFVDGKQRNFDAFLKALSEVEGGTISRSEASALLRCSRQRLHQLVRSGVLCCWQLHCGPAGHDLDLYSEVSVMDLLAYAERVGKPIDGLSATRFGIGDAYRKYQAVNSREVEE